MIAELIPDQIKNDFPILQDENLVYLDNAATSQKPYQVIKAISDYYQTKNANVHRGVHRLSDESTLIYEQARQTISQFFGAKPEELILTRNTTESINGVAYGWADHHLSEGDVILTTPLEHHSNLVVWQQVCGRVGCRLEFVEISEEGLLNLADLEQKLNNFPVKLISLTHISNALGSVLPTSSVADLLNSKFRPEDRPRVVLDGAQSAPHMPIDFSQLGVDFYAFSGHKMLGPMGIGGLLVKSELLNSGEMQPWYFGGGMIAEVSLRQTSFHENPVDRFTPGTPDVASAVGLAAACDYLSQFGMSAVLEHDLQLVEYALERLSSIDWLQLVGPKTAKNHADDLQRLGSVAFICPGIHAHDVAQVLDGQGVAVRSGHHCTMPLHTANDWIATVRASFQIYNSKDDVDRLIQGLEKVKNVFA